ncbi:transcriptional regulator, TetR family [Xylanimonas cellulosilytica DSM 15894]|uniref:Transcriptional regulator, TetR family n=1 Tax=Xylanimonas cellulosilytica (strain DSM 15894 / JCM 12276 / CECT 5975 / KCTC 9989 / LMG 20990 / NBRC 107835 / XIL07) TaxID=446471 RepID=D1BSG3_XYLCX|nr:TetR/AcrR family transcriptional regulator [Xylanimonas cellulosilytica]ACZ30655.1 transcriptional regulator, TetR family [Xylanimonas cellulosilytica DSM 15894]
MTDTEDLRAASRALKDAISGLSRALGQGLADVGADVGREVAAELSDAARELQAELSGAAAATAERGARRSAKAEQTRADLLAAAAKMFAEHGYEAASVADLAKAAGYTKGALYAHFGSKEDLFFALVDEGDVAGDSIVHDELTDILLSLEAYLYALRHPQARPRFQPIAEQQLRNHARRIHAARTGDDGEPTREDIETAMGHAALWAMGGVMAQILPDGWDAPGAFRRLGDRLGGGAPG